MAWTSLWVFLLAGLISPIVTGQTDYEAIDVDSETTDGEDIFDDTEDEDVGEDEDTDGDYGDVFNDYFDDEMRVVDVDQDVAIEACVTNSDALVKKIDKAYNKCFKDFEDWSEFQKNNDGNDQDKDGLSDEYEADEACFYKRMGWVVNNKADKEAIKKDFENLNLNNVKNDFVSSIDACSSWNGKFVGRKKRDAEEDSWALNLARERREAAKNGDGKKPGKGGRNKPGKGNGRRQRNNKADKKDGKGKKVNKNGNGKGKKNSARRNRRRKKNNKDARKERKGKKGNKNRNGNGNGNSKGKGRRRNRTNNKKNKNKNKNKDKENKDKKDKKENKKGKTSGLTRMEKQTIKKLLPETVYNQLWCYELSVEKALENCVKEKILP